MFTRGLVVLAKGNLTIMLLCGIRTRSGRRGWGPNAKVAIHVTFAVVHRAMADRASLFKDLQLAIRLAQFAGEIEAELFE